MSNYHKPLRLAVIAALAVNAQASWAEVAPFTLGEINVTTTQQEESTRLSDGTITQEDLRLFNRETVGTALNTLPGVSMTQGGQRNEQLVQLRGFDLRQVPVFVDGVPVYVTYDGYVDLGRFNTFDLSKIQISKGFSSVLYGPNTLGGAINLVSRKPTKEFEGSITAGIKTDRNLKFNGYATDINMGGKYDMWYWQANTSYIDNDRSRMSSDYKPNAYENGGDRERAYNRDGKINLKIGITPSEGNEYSLNYINQQGAKGSPVYAGSDSGRNANYWDWPKWDKESLYFISRTTFGDTAYLKVRAFYDKFKNVLESYDDARYATMAKGSSFTSIYNDNTYGVSAELGFDIAQHNTLKFAAHYKHDKHEEHNQGDPVQTFEDRTVSFGIEDTHHFTDKLSLVTGVSYDVRDTLKAEGLNNLGQIYDFPKGSAHALNPQAGLFYKPTEDSDIHFTVARKSRFATMKDRFSGRFGRAVANPDLDTEIATHYELGASAFVMPELKLQGSVFFIDTRDMIQSVSLPNSACSAGGGQCFQFRNIGKVQSQGIELGTTWFAGDNLEIGANYTFINRDNLSNDQRLTDVPRQKLFAYSKWQVNSALQVLASVEAASSRYSRQDSTVSYWLSAKGYATGNIKAMYAVNEDWFAEAGINNILDKNYAYTEGFYMEGRNMFVNVTRKF
ncbi:iron complex outermembrane recepter protein [Methylobacillus rhizosphaerae]|uniref:Iron complex outermembrane recepter protein n=1 Tax=Methylobacillus rhizosphaerae TaxID=551994 RepID=A0A239AN15_9PROT|nr:TonB-dependent receptor [Methylobacillus rhizosphaerae]SNR96939.1 iron complex outermembrane recepter protein [Methylobacillus rhizosphaerae]